MVDQSIRRQVMAQIIVFMQDARARRVDCVKAARAEFPGTPDVVLYEAECALDMQEAEAWWQSIEKTIDGEVIRNALSGKVEAANG